MQRFIIKGYSKGYSKGYAEMLYLWGFGLLLVYSVSIYKDIII
jgi:hypothetical protein